MNLKIGTPVEPMLVSELGSSDKKYKEIVKAHKGSTRAEVKYDGYRIQVHKASDTELYTRNLNPLDPGMFPELKKVFGKLPRGIYDGELVGLEPGVKGFNAVKSRMGQDSASLYKDYPLEIRFFDILMHENKNMTGQELVERRKTLENCVENVSSQEKINNENELKDLFEQVTGRGMEGLVCKNPNSLYLPGKKGKDWIKLKNFMTLDLAVLGVYEGEGKAQELEFAAVLVGTRNNNYYETISKIGISNREMINAIYNKIKNSYCKEAPRNIILSKELEKKGYAKKVPAYYVRPENSVVLEVEALNISRSNNWHTCGLKDGQAYSLRIPKIIRLRDDKSIRDCNTSEQVADIYSS